jgi:uncharacterized coiled-coil protein SlyX
MSDDSQTVVARLDALESHVAHQAVVIAELNDVITAQWSKIDALQREIGYLRIELQTMAPQREAPDVPPPHY